MKKFKKGLEKIIIHILMDIWQYGFTEMFNNAIDHSNGTEIVVEVAKMATTIFPLI